MICTDSSIESLLADYYTGELAVSERGRVEAHVAVCEACRSSLLLMESLSGRRAKSPYARGHLAPEVLMSYFRQGEAFPPDRQAEIRAHLDACDSCRAEWQFMSDLNTELESALARREPARQPSSFLRWNWLTSPALAWLLVAAAAYPTLSWLKSRTSPETVGPAALAGPSQLLVEARRGSGRVADVTRTDATALVSLTLPQGALPDEMDYQFTVADENTNEVRPVEIISDLSERGRILLLLNTRGLPDGSYFLQVAEINRTSGALESERGYRFRLVTGP